MNDVSNLAQYGSGWFAVGYIYVQPVGRAGLKHTQVRGAGKVIEAAVRAAIESTERMFTERGAPRPFIIDVFEPCGFVVISACEDVLGSLPMLVENCHRGAVRCVSMEP